MHQDRIPGHENRCPELDERNEIATEKVDAMVEFAALGVLLHRHPSQLTETELIREVAQDPDCFDQADAVRRAVRDLVAAGLVHRHGHFLIPTRPAVRFGEFENRWRHG